MEELYDQFLKAGIAGPAKRMQRMQSCGSVNGDVELSRSHGAKRIAIYPFRPGPGRSQVVGLAKA
jgi:hypothetical protein